MTGNDEVELRSHPPAPAELNRLDQALKTKFPQLSPSERETIIGAYLSRFAQSIEDGTEEVGFFKREGKKIRVSILHALDILAEQPSSRKAR